MMASLVRYPGKREVVVGAVGGSVWCRCGCGGLLGVIVWWMRWRCGSDRVMCPVAWWVRYHGCCCGVLVAVV